MSTRFYCLQCKEPVILKNGKINTPHFAHKRHSECANAFSEGETEDHLQGKLQLYHFYLRKDVQPQLEAYIPDIKQRPDILIQHGQNKIAIEFQCSRIGASKIIERTVGYHQYSISPLWILKTPPISDLPLNEIGIMKISAFRQQFIVSYPSYGKIIITYCPQTKHFLYISNILHIQSNRFIVKIKKLPIDRQTWPFALVKPLRFKEFLHFLHIYRNQRMKHIHHLYQYNRKGVQSAFLQVCYKWQVQPTDLPLYIGTPLLHGEVFQVHAVEWQIQFLDYLHTMKVCVSQATTAHCEDFLLARPIGAVKEKDKLKAIVEYLHILQQTVEKSDQPIYQRNVKLAKMNQLLYLNFLANKEKY